MMRTCAMKIKTVITFTEQEKATLLKASEILRDMYAKEPAFYHRTYSGNDGVRIDSADCGFYIEDLLSDSDVEIEENDNGNKINDDY